MFTNTVWWWLHIQSAIFLFTICLQYTLNFYKHSLKYYWVLFFMYLTIIFLIPAPYTHHISNDYATNTLSYATFPMVGKSPCKNILKTFTFKDCSNLVPLQNTSCENILEIFTNIWHPGSVMDHTVIFCCVLRKFILFHHLCWRVRQTFLPAQVDKFLWAQYTKDLPHSVQKLKKVVGNKSHIN